MTIPTFNQGVMGTSDIALEGSITLDPRTMLTVPNEKAPPSKLLTVANGPSLLVYDVSDPTNPILVRTIG